MVEANKKLQHNMSSVHQTLSMQARILERYLKHYGIDHKEIWDTIEVIKRARDRSKEILKEHFEQLVICKKCGSSEMYQYTKTKDKCEDCGNIQDY